MHVLPCDLIDEAGRCLLTDGSKVHAPALALFKVFGQVPGDGCVDCNWPSNGGARSILGFQEIPRGLDLNQVVGLALIRLDTMNRGWYASEDGGMGRPRDSGNLTHYAVGPGALPHHSPDIGNLQTQFVAVP